MRSPRAARTALLLAVLVAMSLAGTARADSLIATSTHPTTISSYVWSASRSYKPCSPYNQFSDVSVNFTKRHGKVVVEGKSSFWIHNF